LRRIRIGVSSCLLGEAVRWNGGHKRDALLAGELARWFEFVPFCPEVAIGLGVPRATLRLQAAPRGARAVQPATGRDVTAPLAAYGREVAAAEPDLDGYVFKSRSPSCGIARVKVYDRNGMPSSTAAGIYAQALRAALPLLPVEDEGRLNDETLRDNFICRVFVHRRWRLLRRAGLGKSALLRFHAEHKFLVMAHSQAAARELGRLLSDLKRDFEAKADAYFERLMQALARPATHGNQVNALQHAAGYFRKVLDAPDRRELADSIAAYGNNQVPIIAPLTLIRHHLRRHPQAWLDAQQFLKSRSSD
jgi:uncharacterized protein YbgA (DUF1722 family)/uncharacterized protein YbbK (DUF523 family)